MVYRKIIEESEAYNICVNMSLGKTITMNNLVGGYYTLLGLYSSLNFFIFTLSNLHEMLIFQSLKQF